MTRPWTVALSLLAVAALGLAPDVAEARQKFPPNRFRTDGSYFHLKPGVLAFNVENTGQLGYQWGLGGGAYWSTRSGFAAAVGGDVEHWFVLKDIGDFHLLTIGPEVRLGYSRPRWFLYGMFGATFNAYIVDNALFGQGDTGVGVGFPFGIGFWGLVARRFYMGTELGPDVDLYFYTSVFGSTEVTTIIPFQWKVMLGWRL